MEVMLPSLYFTHKKVHSAQYEVQQTRVGFRKLLTPTIVSGLQAWVRDTVYEINSKLKKVREQCNCVIQVFYYKNIFEGLIY